MKDPAVLFYFQDFLVGTEFMTDDEVGKYIRILCHQADKGALSESQLKRICRSEIPEAIKEKLLVDENGNYYQRRMQIEKEKRNKHIEHQRNNANKRWNKTECHGNATAMPLENEDEDVNRNINGKEIKEVVDFFNSTSFGKVQKLTKARKKHITSRIKDYSYEGLIAMFKRADKSRFLHGQNDREWKADFDWLINPNNCIKVIEGKYDNKTSSNPAYKQLTGKET